MEIQGIHLGLRFVEQEDAEFILDLRMKKGKYLSATSNDVYKQKIWIEEYKKREKENSEFYFIIFDKLKEERVGVVRLYNFIDDSFEWGSWIIKEGASQYSALESALLIYEYAFFQKKFNQSHFEVRKENLKVISFHEKFGAKKIKESEIDNYYIYSLENYLEFRKKYLGKYINF